MRGELERELAELDALPMYLSVRQAAGVLRVSERTIGRMRQRGELSSHHVGSRVRIPRASVKSWAIREDDSDTSS
jgi:excisionase family DNA binding protein